jgi:hypothetical protein
MMKRAFLFLVTSVFFANLYSQAQSAGVLSNTSTNDVILLITPFDKDTIDELDPVFNWTLPVNPSVRIGDGADLQLQFKFTLVKINSDQTRETAIMQNQPLYVVSPLQGSMLKYPITATPLERGSRYAWRIDKYLNGALVNQSEVWEFYIKEVPVPKVRQLAILSQQYNNKVYYTSDSIGLYYKEQYSLSTLALQVLDEKGVVISEGLRLECALGDNAFYYSLSDLGIGRKGAYDLKIKNNKNETYSIKVRYL